MIVTAFAILAMFEIIVASKYSHLIAATHHIFLCLVLLTVDPSVELSRPGSKVGASRVVHRVGIAHHTVGTRSVRLSNKLHLDTFSRCRAAITGGSVDLDRVDQNLPWRSMASVLGRVADWSR